MEQKFFHLGLTGYPLGHSLSPAIHAAALRACGLTGDYSSFPILPHDSVGLMDLLSRVRDGSLDGLNVTIPHKQTVVEMLDELTPVASTVGAVNTIHLRDGILVGDNTDAAGFSTDLNRFLGEAGIDQGQSALVFGAGGAARAVVYALLNDGWDVIVSSRRFDQAREMSKAFYDDKVKAMEAARFDPRPFRLFVNTTPLGMWPDKDQSPWPEAIPFPRAAAIYDLVYNPRETKLVRDACAQGLAARTGLGMLIEQAALAFEKWTGYSPPLEALWRAVDQLQMKEN